VNRLNLLLLLSVLLALILGSSALGASRDTKFVFNESVKVTNGFYKDCCGHVKSFNVNSYNVEGTCRHENFIADIEQTDLVLIHGRCE
jgi:hypothetical protein